MIGQNSFLSLSLRSKAHYPINDRIKKERKQGKKKKKERHLRQKTQNLKEEKTTKLRDKHGSQKMENQLKFQRTTLPSPNSQYLCYFLSDLLEL